MTNVIELGKSPFELDISSFKSNAAEALRNGLNVLKAENVGSSMNLNIGTFGIKSVASSCGLTDMISKLKTNATKVSSTRKLKNI